MDISYTKSASSPHGGEGELRMLRDMFSKFAKCFNEDPSVSSIVKCMNISKRDFYEFVNNIRGLCNVFFVPNLTSSNMILVEVEEPNINFVNDNVDILIDLGAKKKMYLYVPLPFKKANLPIRALEEVLKAIIKAEKISLYSLKLVCYDSFCIYPRKIVARPSWGETIVSLELTEDFLLPKELAVKLAPLVSWQRLVHLIKGAASKGLILGPICRLKDRDLLTVMMDVSLEDDIFDLKGIPHWVEDTLVILKKINGRNNIYSLIFSTRPRYLDMILKLDKAGALSFKIKRLALFSGGTRILPSLRKVLTPQKHKKMHPVELFANSLLKSRNTRTFG